MLVSFPNMGSPRPIEEINIRELRVFPVNGFKTYLIWYHPLATHDGIEIVRVLHHSRDAPTHLAGESADS